MAKRMIETSLTEEDVKIEGSLRPQVLADYIGQSKVKQTLQIYIEAAKQRGDALDHLQCPVRLWGISVRHAGDRNAAASKGRGDGP